MDDPARLRAIALREMDRAIQDDRLALSRELARIVRRRVPRGGTLTEARARRIMADYEAYRRRRYGSRRGDTRGSLYNLVADTAGLGWVMAVTRQAADLRNRVLRGRR